MRTPSRPFRLGAALAALSLVLAACGGTADGSDAGAEPTTDLAVVATTTVLGDIVENVVGDGATVEVLMPIGADPHDFQASSAQVAVVNEADLVVANGLFLEEGLADVLDSAAADGANVFEVAPLLDPIPFGEGGHDHDHEGEESKDEDDHAHGEDDHDHEGEGDHDHSGVAHACGHFDDDPVDVEADGSIPDDHTRYSIALADGSAGVGLERDEEGAISVFLGDDVPVTLIDDAGSEVDATSTETVGDECAEIATMVTFDLEPGAYVLEMGPADGLDTIDLVWEEASHDHGHDHEGDHDHEGEEAKDEGDHDHEGDDHHHHHGSDDPHVWLDPVRMAEAARLIAGELAAIDDSVDWMANAEAYAAELEALDGEIVDLLAGIPAESRKLVTNHEALGYFADRYDFEMVGVIIPGGSTLGDPSSEELAELVATMQAEGVDVVFGETTDPSALADAVAAELGTDAQVVELFTGSLGEPGSGAETYVEMMRTNAERIADALG